ncbi:hypothetical protein K1W54_08620 [Micromonospora sp. CPCC 205371]|nr:hypothetical protein [Micromonospora sp. CPCC 205371]
MMSADGTWRTLVGPSGGRRVFADFLPAGRDQGVVLGLDVPVGGTYQSHLLPAPSGTRVPVPTAAGQAEAPSGDSEEETVRRLRLRLWISVALAVRVATYTPPVPGNPSHTPPRWPVADCRTRPASRPSNCTLYPSETKSACRYGSLPA